MSDIYETPLKGGSNLEDPRTDQPPGVIDVAPSTNAPRRSSGMRVPATVVNEPGPLQHNSGASYLGGLLHAKDYMRVIHKRRWTVITSFVLVLGSIAVYTFTATPLFESRVLIQIENQEQTVVQFQQVIDENRTTNDYYQTQYRILQSRLLARRTLDAEKLWDHPSFSPVPKDSAVTLNPISWLRAVSQAVQGVFGSELPHEGPDPAETSAQSAAVDRFLRHLTITPVRNSRLVEVKYRSTDALLSARLANALTKQYIGQNLEFRFMATKEASEFLSARMKEQRGALDQSEQALQKYREQTGAVALEDRQNIVVQRLADLNEAVTKARTERIQKEAIHKQVREVQNNKAVLDTVPAILSNGFIQQLKATLAEHQRQRAQMEEKLGERHPEMVKIRSAIESTEARINAEVQKIVQALRNDYQAALSNERALQASLDQQRGEAQELNRSGIQYGVLARDTATNRQMFDSLLQRSKETNVAGELKTSSIRVVDQAEVPRSQASPNVRNNLLIGLFGGLLMSLALAFFFDYMDDRVRTPEEIKTQLGLPFLGMVPWIDTKKLTGAPLVDNDIPQNFSEAFRSIRTSVLFASTEDGFRSILITSTGPGEGKTVVASNLAMTLAAAGQRVLLIDADMRRPKVNELFRIKLEPGLSNVIVGDGKASDAIKKVPVPGLWVMAAGKHPPNPAELLGSNRFREFVASLGQHFDWLVVDTPPVMAVTDASVVAHLGIGVVFVVGSEMTSRGAIKTALDHLDAARAKYVGGILNRVDLSRNAYYYSSYYRKEYEEYYTRKS